MNNFNLLLLASWLLVGCGVKGLADWIGGDRWKP